MFFQNKCRIFDLYSEEIYYSLRAISKNKIIENIDYNRINELLDSIETYQSTKEIIKVDLIKDEIYKTKKLKNKLKLIQMLQHLIRQYENSKETEKKLGFKKEALNLFLEVNYGKEMEVEENYEISWKIKSMVQ